MTDNEIITINLEKYACALNNLIGADNAYFNGDKDIDAIIEVIRLAKKMENVIKQQKVEIEKLNNSLKTVRKVNGQLTEPTYIKSIRVKAVKEFSERLKKDKIKPEFPWDDFTVTEGMIDELVEEFTEGK